MLCGGDLFLPIFPQKTPPWREMDSGLKQRCLSCQICAQPFQGKPAGQVTVWGAPHTSGEITVSPGGGTGPCPPVTCHPVCMAVFADGVTYVSGVTLNSLPGSLHPTDDGLFHYDDTVFVISYL